MTKFSKEFKDSLVSKVLYKPGRSIRSVALEAQVGVSSLHKWVHEAEGGMTNGPLNQDGQIEKRPIDWSMAQKFQAIMGSITLNNEEINHYCRQQGIYKSQLEQWKLDFMSDKEPTRLPKQHANELKMLRDQNKQLTRELNRKEKALAEVAALLVLKKKADAIWPVNEDD